MRTKGFSIIIVLISFAFSACTVHPDYTTLTDENYALAESQTIFKTRMQRIVEATGTNGTGIFMHEREISSPNDKSVMRLNFDTRYSYAIVDLKEPATLVMPETNGRYQSAWIITEEHYNPLGINKPGTYTLTQEAMGSQYIVIALRTMVNMNDSADMEEVTRLQDEVKLIQKDRGEYAPKEKWNMKDLLAMRKKYQQIQKEKSYASEFRFGKKGELTQEAHNCGTACGWGGFTKDQAVYPFYYPTDSNPCTMTLKDVPVAENAFWSITVYDADGYPRGHAFHINSTTAVPNEDGSYTIHFGGKMFAHNYLEIYEGWNMVLRLYLPQPAYFDGSWKVPELVPVT